jgi:hypothetical protein
LVEVTGQPVGRLAHHFTAVLGGRRGQIRLGAFAGRGIHPAGQLVEEATDHRHKTRAGLTLALRGGSASRGASGSPVIDRRGPKSADSATRRLAPATRDAQPVGQGAGLFAAQLGRSGVLDQLIAQRVAGHRQPTRLVLEPFQQRQALRCGQRVIRMPDDAEDNGVQRVEVLPNLVAAARKHV